LNLEAGERARRVLEKPALFAVWKPERWLELAVFADAVSREWGQPLRLRPGADKVVRLLLDELAAETPAAELAAAGVDVGAYLKANSGNRNMITLGALQTGLDNARAAMRRAEAARQVIDLSQERLRAAITAERLEKSRRDDLRRGLRQANTSTHLSEKEFFKVIGCTEV
jgi:hypothetical protein